MYKDEDIDRWITVNGNHIPIRKGQTQREALEEFLHIKQEKDALR